MEGKNQDVTGVEKTDTDTKKLIFTAVVVSCVIGLAVTAYLVYETGREDNYAVLYLEPGSYSNYLEGDTITFTYGIKQYGEMRSK